MDMTINCWNHYHINDYAGGYMDWRNLRTLPVGKGKNDFKRFFKFTKKIAKGALYAV